MGNPNKTTRTILRWTHVLVGFLIGVFVYTPAHDNETFVLLMQAAVIPAVTLTGVWMWQQARLRRLCRRVAGTNRPRGRRRERKGTREIPDRHPIQSAIDLGP